MFTGTCRMPVLRHYYSSLFLCSRHSIFHLYFIGHAQLTWNPRFGCHKWMIFSVQSEWKFSSQNMFWNWSGSNDETSWNKIKVMSYNFSTVSMTILGFNDMSRQRFEELKVVHLSWHPKNIVSLRLISCVPVNEAWNCRSSSKCPNKYGPLPIPITHPMI